MWGLSTGWGVVFPQESLVCVFLTVSALSQAVRLGAPLGFRAAFGLASAVLVFVARSVGVARFIAWLHYCGKIVPFLWGERLFQFHVSTLEDPRHQRFVDWLTTPKGERQPKLLRDLASELGVADRTLRDWKEKPAIRAVWEEQAKKVVGSPERAQDVLEAMFARAVDASDPKQVQAAKLYLEAIEAIKPPTVEVRSVSELAKVSDDELQAMIAATAQGMLEERKNG